MAIGLGRMFGFKFLENFNYPYVSMSIQEFWHRWHISLSSWFRDYLYIPLGGSRVPPWRTYLNLWIVFLLCGAWHGASWNFVIWGMLHGVYLVIERMGFGTMLNKAWRPLRHGYTLLLIIVAWVFFRAETVPMALHYLKAMFGLGFHDSGQAVYSVIEYSDSRTITVLIAGCFFATPGFTGYSTVRQTEMATISVVCGGRHSCRGLLYDTHCPLGHFH